MKPQQVEVSRIFRRQSLYASVIRACKNCGAPGYWHNIQGVNPGCFAPEKVTQLEADPVGLICPQCGAARGDIERKGEIWSKEWRVSLWSLVKQAVKGFFNQKERTLQ